MSQKNTYNRILKKTAPTGRADRFVHGQYLETKKSGLKIAASVVAIMTVVLFGATLVTANSVAASANGSTISSQIQQLDNENANLTVELAQLTSVTQLYNEAMAQGFVIPEKSIYAVGNQPPTVTAHP